jgi:hypothetical protein
MHKRTALLIGPVLALLLVLVALAIPWRASKPAPATPPRPPSATSSVPTAPPVVGADGIGDPYFPRAGNGGYDITAYDIAVRYDPPTDRLEGHTTITATGLPARPAPAAAPAPARSAMQFAYAWLPPRH